MPFPPGGGTDALARVHREEIKCRKRDRETDRPIRHLWPEAIAGWRQSWYLSTTVSTGECRLKRHVRKIRAIEQAFAGTHRFNHRQVRARRRMRFEIRGSGRQPLRQVREATRREFDRRPGGADGIGQRGSSNIGGLDGLTELILGNRQLGVRP